MSALEDSKMDAIIIKFIEGCNANGKSTKEILQNGVEEVYGILRENKLLPKTVAKARKSDEESEKLRASGNIAYKARDFEEALASYTRAICSGETEGRPMALAYANRSAVHYELQAFNDAIKDVNHALDTGSYPEDMKHKLFERRAKSHMALSQYGTAMEDFKRVVALLVNDSAGNSSKLNGDSDQQPTNQNGTFNGHLDHAKIMSLIANGKLDREKVLRLQPLVELMSKCAGKPNICQRESSQPKLSHRQSKNAKGPFPAMDIAVSPEMGKHIVAATSVSPGDILAVEKPYVSVLTPEFYLRFCDNCRAECRASIPCGKCNNVVYCSENCQVTAWESQHSIECDLLPTAVSMGCKVNVLIGVRGLVKCTRSGRDLQRFVSEHQSKVTLKSKDKVKNTKTKTAIQGQGHSEGYLVHNLVTHEEDRSEVQAVGAMATVSCIVHVMRSVTRFFGGPDSEKPLNLNHVVAANLIARYFMMAGCNAFEIRESNSRDSRVIGGALYPTLCLLNHSCDPDVAAYMHTEETRVLYAVKPVRKGEQMFISYGPEYTHQDFSVRQKQLRSKYFFTCRCPPCVNDWPTAAALPEHPVFVSPRVESAQGQRIYDTCKKLPEILRAAEEGLVSEEQMEAAAQFVTLYHKYVLRPWKYYFAAQTVIRQYFHSKGKQNQNMNKAEEVIA